MIRGTGERRPRARHAVADRDPGRARKPRRATAARISALCAALGVVAALFAPMPIQTEAAWTDAETARASFGTYRVPMPVYTSCSATGLLGLDSVLTVNWRAPANAAGLTVEYGQSDSSGLLLPITDALLGDVTTTAVSGDPGAYKTVVRVGLLGGVTGGSKSIGIRYSLPNAANDWKSQWMTVSGTWYLLGLGTPKCALLS